MKRTYWIALSLVGSSFAPGQTLGLVYNRDSHEPFHLKKVDVESTVIGPVVRTDTMLTFENPFLKQTEATINFEMPPDGALGGFAYFYGSEYVAGKLMDKNEAWRIYTAITSRNRDPGIMEQWSPTTYHCQIFPIRNGQDLRVRLWTVGILAPEGKSLTVPKANMADPATSKPVEPNWTVRGVKSAPISRDGEFYRVASNEPMSALAERFKDGRVYVAGLVREDVARLPKIEVVQAYYEPQNQGKGGIDVTGKVEDILSRRGFQILASNRQFGDPTPNQFKELRVRFKTDGIEQVQTVAEGQTMNLLHYRPDVKAAIHGLHEPKTIFLNESTFAFAGWAPKNGKIEAEFGGQKTSIVPTLATKGSDTARIWAQQMLADPTGHWTQERAIRFSKKYGVPSSATALLAVPKEEWKNYLKREAEARRNALEEGRKKRNWSGDRNQNWNASGGGDPEIRITLPGAKSVQAILPDRRVIDLTSQGDVWGGNFEIPATAAEGAYPVKVVAQMADGSTQEKEWTYQVDRTAPVGKAEFLVEDGALILQVKSEPGLAEVAAYKEDGEKLVLKETEPGVYRIEVPRLGRLIVVMKDRAGNKGELTLRG